MIQSSALQSLALRTLSAYSRGKRQFRKLKAFGKEWLLQIIFFLLFSSFWLEVVQKLRSGTFKAENAFCIVSIKSSL